MWYSVLPALLTSTSVQIMFDDPAQAAAFGMSANTSAVLVRDSIFQCEHNLRALGAETISCQWQDVLRLSMASSPTPVPIRVS